MWQMIGVLAELERSSISERNPRQSESRAAPGREVWQGAKLTPQHVEHARKLIDKGEARQYVAT